jgi:hypothetical protein
MSLDSSFAVLTKSGLLRTTQEIPGEASLSRRAGTLWGLAFRPAHSDALNGLAKVEYVDALNPVGGGVLAARGTEARIIAAFEGVWTPEPAAEFSARVAIRATSAAPIYSDSSTMLLRSNANYLAGRWSFRFVPQLAARVDLRLLVEHTTKVASSDAAPQLALMLGGVETTVGYRFGNLHDPDFAVLGGRGAFLSVGAALTEKSAKTVAGFWRQRLARQ